MTSLTTGSSRMTLPDLDLMKQVNRQFVTGVTVVTTMDNDTPRGLAVNAFSSISLEPPTVMVCVQQTSSTHECLFRAQHLAINIMSVEQMDVVSTFATKAADKCEAQAAEKKLAGAAKTSFVKKCVADAGG